jgi:hypothetical protein
MHEPGRIPRALLAFSLVLPILAAGFAPPAETARSGPPTQAATERTPEAHYRAACLSCHGPDGRGMPATTVGFDVPLPDFTDCAFARREPDADWVSIAHEGGPMRAFDPLMPAFGGVYSEAELGLAVEHIRTFCVDGEAWPRGELNLPRPVYTSKAFPEDEAVVETTVATQGDTAIRTELIYETRIGARGQVEAVLPVIFRQQAETDGDWTGGIGDLVLGTKWAVLHSLATGSILSGGLDLVFPTGREDRGLGTGVWRFEPFLAYGQILPADAFLHLQVGAELSAAPDRVAHEVFWRLALGMTFAQDRGFGRAWAPMVEVLGAVETVSGATVDWDVAPLLHVTLSQRQHVRVALGVRLPLNDFEKRPTYVVAYILWDWFDGGLGEGW